MLKADRKIDFLQEFSALKLDVIITAAFTSFSEGTCTSMYFNV
jgi:hypothetical protein